MLNQTTIDKIAGLLKIKPDELKTALTATDEVDVTIDDKLKVVTDDELATVKSNGYKEGKSAGVEMGVDEIKKEMSLDFTGKTIKGLVEAVGKKTLADAKIEPEKKVTELQEKITTLQNTVKEFETKLSEKDSEVSSIKTQTETLKHIPAGTKLPAEKVIGLMKMDGYDFKIVEGKLTPFLNGKEVQDHLSNALDPKTVIAKYVTDNSLADEKIDPKFRKDGKDENGNSKHLKLSEIKAKYAAEGKSTLGTEFAKEVEEAAKVDGFDMNA